MVKKNFELVIRVIVILKKKKKSWINSISNTCPLKKVSKTHFYLKIGKRKFSRSKLTKIISKHVLFQFLFKVLLKWNLTISSKIEKIPTPWWEIIFRKLAKENSYLENWKKLLKKYVPSTEKLHHADNSCRYIVYVYTSLSLMKAYILLYEKWRQFGWPLEGGRGRDRYSVVYEYGKRLAKRYKNTTVIDFCGTLCG